MYAVILSLLKETLKKNEGLEISPVLKQHKFRDRNMQKEIGPEFRFGPRNEEERIADSIQSAGLSQVQAIDLVGNTL